MVEKKSLYIKRTFFANKVLLGFDNNVILWLGTDWLTLEDVFHDIDLRKNLFKEGEDGMDQVRSKFDIKMFVNKFCKIKHIYQTLY
jgi:hypothetical protein